MSITIPAGGFDVVIVGSGISGSIIAYQLGKAGKQVLILEGGPPVPKSREDYMQTFFTANAKTPESPYPPTMQGAGSKDNSLGQPDPATLNTPRYTVLQIKSWQNPAQCYFEYEEQQATHADDPKMTFAFGSSYERVAGGTTWHWLGTSLNHLPNDFQLKTKYGQGVDWPGGVKFYEALLPYYRKATETIGVSSDKQPMVDLYKTFNVQPDGTYGPNYDFPMPGIVPSMNDVLYADNVKSLKIDDIGLFVTPTPQGRNSQPGKRRQCAGNTNCIPICPIQAKYDGTVTLAEALQTGNVQIQYKTVASNISLKGDQVSGIDYLTYDSQTGKSTGKDTAVGKRYVLAAHAIETPKLLLMSKGNPGYPNGVANRSDQVGRNLMDHVMYLAWGLAKDPIYAFRGPLSTSGIESVRDGAFRGQRAAYRIEIGNEGWNWATNDPYTTLADFVFGQNNTQLNGDSVNQQGQSLRFDPNLPAFSQLYGSQLVKTLNAVYTRQLRLGYLIEQLPNPDNRVELSDKHVDHLGLPRPKVTYRIRENYVRNGFVSAKAASTAIFKALGATEYTKVPDAPVLSGPSSSPTTFQYLGDTFTFYGAGHIIGTYRMGDSAATSVLNARQQSWDHSNLYMVGSGVFPTTATANPTLTIAALALQAADNILADLG
ncbi:Glucose-methanol-choline (GMC) oxidoreductase:NAD binding site [Lysobacter capsici AZ78]|uniref:Glucose-methanol-choline (GMC) oxidoreductase:NAD binding site n=1 Tax=Lysobacter capsici AZ78 TaxID=1444315 RepID=A0A120AGQ2_9GAMM|nr:GMC family oxidoreductase [Lysobacter capsici]KWS04938.1 Glucose-methanol-choline (GMC) oxidoreductase:NAD binding site [Lysobacter capsici AZ78]